MTEDQNNTGYVWMTDEARYFLRDDTAMGIYEFDERQTYSLFRQYPDYCRVCIITSLRIEWVLPFAGEHVVEDILERTGKKIDPDTILLDEFEN